MQTTVTRPPSWVRWPTASPMAVRLPLLLHREAADETGAEVGAAEGEQLALCIDGLALA